MHKITFLIPYFGKWPEWMPLFIDSLERNSSIDFHFFTDCDTDITNSKNIIFHSMSFDDYVSKFKKVLGDDIQIPNAYKICDLRPFFGIIHEDIIKDYDFFGWTDVDLVFGDIRSFYTEDILNKYEVLSSHKVRLAGHCSLLRTTEKYKKMGFKVYNWKEALQNPEFVGIDEHGMTNALRMTFFDKVAEKFKMSTDNFILNALRMSKTKKYYFVEQYSTPFTPIPWLDGTINSNQPSSWVYHQGKITNKTDGERDFMYLHFMNFKSSTWRHDGTPAPWEGRSIYNVEDIDLPVIIDLEGIRN